MPHGQTGKRASPAAQDSSSALLVAITSDSPGKPGASSPFVPRNATGRRRNGAHSLSPSWPSRQRRISEAIASASCVGTALPTWSYWLVRGPVKHETVREALEPGRLADRYRPVLLRVCVLA